MSDVLDVTALQVEVVVATRYGQADFWAKSALGQSFDFLHRRAQIRVQVACENAAPLPLIYNQAIARADGDILVFMHDDVWLQDIFFVDRIAQALSHCDIVGVAGTTRRAPRQVTWYHNGYKQETPEPDWGYLSGVIGHGPTPMEGHVGAFGQTPATCELLDGVLLAAQTSTLRATGLRFDPRFHFHLYDLDFCRSARQLGLRLGTCQLSVTHQSIGHFRSESWRKMRDEYLAKWES